MTSDDTTLPVLLACTACGSTVESGAHCLLSTGIGTPERVRSVRLLPYCVVCVEARVRVELMLRRRAEEEEAAMVWLARYCPVDERQRLWERARLMRAAI